MVISTSQYSHVGAGGPIQRAGHLKIRSPSAEYYIGDRVVDSFIKQITEFINHQEYRKQPTKLGFIASSSTGYANT